MALPIESGAVRLFGYLPSDVVGASVARLFTPEDRQLGRRAAELAEACERESASNRNWLMRQDGSRFRAEGEIIALREPSGRLLGFGKVV
jgi:PAS domain S-box-containing protein